MHILARLVIELIGSAAVIILILIGAILFNIAYDAPLATATLSVGILTLIFTLKKYRKVFPRRNYFDEFKVSFFDNPASDETELLFLKISKSDAIEFFWIDEDFWTKVFSDGYNSRASFRDFLTNEVNYLERQYKTFQDNFLERELRKPNFNNKNRNDKHISQLYNSVENSWRRREAIIKRYFETCEKLGRSPIDELYHDIIHKLAQAEDRQKEDLEKKLEGIKYQNDLINKKREILSCVLGRPSITFDERSILADEVHRVYIEAFGRKIYDESRLKVYCLNGEWHLEDKQHKVKVK